MLIQFTPNGGLIPATLGDDANKFGVTIEQLGGSALAQIETLAGGGFPAQFPRGNVSGDFVFRSTKTYPDNKTTFSTFKTQYGWLNQQGTLILTEGGAGAVTLVFVGAILRNLQRPFDSANAGARMSLRYTFAITTIL
jgi:hypothetical protein